MICELYGVPGGPLFGGTPPAPVGVFAPRNELMGGSACVGPPWLDDKMHKLRLATTFHSKRVQLMHSNSRRPLHYSITIMNF